MADKNIDGKTCLDLWNKGVFYWESGQYQAAVNCFDSALKLKPDFAEAWNLKGVCLKYQRKFAQAIECFEKAIKLEDKNDSIESTLAEKGNTLTLMKKPDEALKCLNDVLKINPNHGDALIYKTFLLFKTKDFEEANAILNKIPLNNKNQNKLEFIYLKGIQLTEEFEFEDAIKKFNLLLNKHPDFVDALIAQGDCYNKWGKYKGAIESYEKALELVKDSIEALLGKLNSEENVSSQANFINFESNTVQDNCKKDYYKIAEIFQNNKNIKRLRNFSELIAIKPETPALFELRADVFFEFQELDLALKDYEAALVLDKENSTLMSKKDLVVERLSKQAATKNESNLVDKEMKYREVFSNDLIRNIENSEIHVDEIVIRDSIEDQNEDEYNSLKKEVEKSILRFSKIRKEISSIDQTKIKEEDRKEIENALKGMENLELEANKINKSISHNQTVEDNSSMKKTSNEIKDKISELEKKLENLMQKYQNVNEKLNLIELRISNTEKELETCLKNHERIILGKLKGKIKEEELIIIEDFIYGFKTTLSNVFVASQIIASNLIKIDNSNFAVSIMALGFSVIPVFGNLLRSGVDSVWEFINERMVRNDALKILRISNESIQFSQKIGTLLEELFDNENVRIKIINAVESIVNKNSGSFFDKIFTFIQDAKDKIQCRVYYELFSTPSKKLGFLHANLIIENIYKDQLTINDHFSKNVIEIIRNDLEINYKKCTTIDLKSDYVHKASLENKKNEKVKISCGVCSMF